MKTLVLFVCFSVLGGCAQNITKVDIRTERYSAPVDIYWPPEDVQSKKATILALHGKRHGRRHDGNVDMAQRLSKAGYTVYAPEMPWGEAYTAPLSDAFLFLDRLVELAAQKGHRVFITGHSQGAPVALAYASLYKTPDSVKGVVLLAPGHLIHESMLLMEATASSVQKARRLVAQGTKHEKHDFRDLNQGSSFGITTTPEIYLSYFDPKLFPSHIDGLQKLKVPILWIDGENDILSRNMNYAYLYKNYTKRHALNRYVVVPGGHVGMWFNTSDPIIDWLSGF